MTAAGYQPVVVGLEFFPLEGCIQTAGNTPIVGSSTDNTCTAHSVRLAFDRRHDALNLYICRTPPTGVASLWPMSASGTCLRLLNPLRQSTRAACVRSFLLVNSGARRTPRAPARVRPLLSTPVSNARTPTSLTRARLVRDENEYVNSVR